MTFPSMLFMLGDSPSPIDFNCTEGVQWIWFVFHQCAVTPKEVVGVSFGLLSASIWIVFAIPQIVENCRKGIPDQALSPYLLVCFLMGDLINFLGCLLLHQLPLQTIMALIGVTADCIQISQFLYYKFKHKFLRAYSNLIEVPSQDPNSSTSESCAGDITASTASMTIVCIASVFAFSTIYTYSSNLVAPESSTISTNPNPLITTPAPIPEPFLPTTGLLIGFILGWVSTSIYLTSRFFQLAKNWKRGSTEGLSPVTFALAVVGNTSYGLQIFLTFSDRKFLLRSMPWLFGSFGCITLDFCICAQFCYFKKRDYARLEREGAENSLSEHQPNTEAGTATASATC